MKWHLIVVLICVSLVTNIVEHLFMFIGHLYNFFGEMSVQVLCPFLSWVNCGQVVGILYIFWIHIYDFQIFSLCGLFFHLLMSSDAPKFLI